MALRDIPIITLNRFLSKNEDESPTGAGWRVRSASELDEIVARQRAEAGIVVN